MTRDDIPLRKIDHVRFFVGNARQSAYFYRNAFGFDVIAYAGLETQRQARSGLCPSAGEDHASCSSRRCRTEHPESQRLVTARRRRDGYRHRRGRRRRKRIARRRTAAASA